ncbi:MAG: hypothetical protein JG780_93 [Thermosipho sp. (in: Bacteria)]|jgi:hypothetical protein|nr:hypothetical protein [Thermosipho sp. (in: thermotogales)]
MTENNCRLDVKPPTTTKNQICHIDKSQKNKTYTTILRKRSHHLTCNNNYTKIISNIKW